MHKQLAMTDSLSSLVQYVKGIGPKRAAALRSVGVQTVRDLLYFFPRDYLDLSRLEKIGSLRRLAASGQYVTAIGTVRAFDLIGRYPKQRFIVVLGDETGTIRLVFFKNLQYFKKAFSVGEALAVSGKPSLYHHQLQIVHPDFDRLETDEKGEGTASTLLHTKGIVPVYRSNATLSKASLETKAIRRIVKGVFDQFLTSEESIREFLPDSIIKKHKFLSVREALQQIHFPSSQRLLHEAQRRLKFDELFFLQLLLAVRRSLLNNHQDGISCTVESKLARRLVDSLPFRLTRAQVRVIREIAEDMRSSRSMNRLLQGDVGSGKTIVALTAMLIAADNGYQSALMAPTEILAEQHFHTLKQFLAPLNDEVGIRLLIGGQREKLRTDVVEDIRRGTAHIVVGTHALIQERVEFSKLGLVVVDEQHRFGVAQRLALREKGFLSHNRQAHPDVLIMTATPIPRTLSLTLYGDLDVSVIDELPLHRKPIKTLLKYESQRKSMFDFLRKEIAAGRQVYVVYPLVEESEKLDLKAATESFDYLREEVFPDLQVGLIHGRMSADEKDTIMAAFKQNRIHILVSTTVIEVGIDIPNATVMVIEHAERFGLAQLHQLRGRVGRGAEQSYCILVAPNWMARMSRFSSANVRSPLLGIDQSLSDEVEVQERNKAAVRLNTMLQTTDGFKIAEVDLRLRGPGDFFGSKQSGFPELTIADLLTDTAVLAVARQEAFSLIERDPTLTSPEHKQLKLYFQQHYRQYAPYLFAS